MLINFKMPTIVGILAFMSRINFVLSWFEYEKSVVISGSGCSLIWSQTLRTDFFSGFFWITIYLWWWFSFLTLCILRTPQRVLKQTVTVCDMSGYRCVSNFDQGPVSYLRGDRSWNNFYCHSPLFGWIIQEGLLSVTSESICTKYWLEKVWLGELTVSPWP